MRWVPGVPLPPAPLPQGVTLVPFDAAIAPACRDLMNLVYGAGFGDPMPFEAWWPALEADPEFDPALCYVATSVGDVVGYCQSWTVPFVKDLVVDPAYRGRGLGAALLTLALERYTARGAAFVDLKTDVDNLTAQSLYLKLGFTVVERIG